MMPSPKSLLLVVNDGPYGNERSYNVLRTALTLLKLESAKVMVFLIGDGAQCARRSHETPQGYCKVERMIASQARNGEVATRGSYSKARGLGPTDMIEGVLEGNMELLATWLSETDQALVF